MGLEFDVYRIEGLSHFIRYVKYFLGLLALCIKFGADQYSGLSIRPEHTDRQIQRLRDPLLYFKLRPNLMGRDVLFYICFVSVV